MGQRQIQSLNLLAMGADDLREEIYAQAEKNPALEIEDDDFESGVKNVRLKTSLASDYLRVGNASAAGEEKSRAFQEVLESRPDERRTLFDHLMEQLSVLRISPEENALCKKIIGNLDERGFFILAPAALLNPSLGEDAPLLEKCLSIVRGFEPSGICVADTRESLLLQARQKGGANEAVLFLLDGHLEFLDPPQPQKVLKKIHDFEKAQKTLFGNAQSNPFGGANFSFEKNLSLSDIQDAIDFIKTLDPFPARNFSSTTANYISPDVFVEKIPVALEEVDFKKREIPAENDFSFKIRISDKLIPRVKISSEFISAQKNSEFAKEAVKTANIFLEGLEFRETTIAAAMIAIVQRQLEFFKRGPGHLSPLRQQDIAEEIGVHESTISRMALSKFIQCEWGIFPVKYFFTNALPVLAKENSTEIQPSQNANPSGDFVSKENVKIEIQKILQEHSGEKSLSDQKIADILLERGIKLARRTVAKYRAQLDVKSSYFRD